MAAFDDASVVEAERRRILDVLEASFGRFELAELAGVVDTLEQMIERHCEQRVRELLTALSDVRKGEGSGYLLGPFDEYFELTVTRDVRQPTTLLVTLLPRSPTRDWEPRRSIDLGGSEAMVNTRSWSSLWQSGPLSTPR